MNIGRIELYIGPMFSGKTSLLLKNIRLNSLQGRSHIIIKHTSDTRYVTDSILNHDKEVGSFIYNVVSLNKINTDFVSILRENYDVIGIEEAHFFDDIASISDYLANSNKTVMITGIESDINRKMFSEIAKLIPISDKIIKLHGICMGCLQEKSVFNKLKHEIPKVYDKSDKNYIQVGEKDAYIAVCRKCYYS